MRVVKVSDACTAIGPYHVCSHVCSHVSQWPRVPLRQRLEARGEKNTRLNAKARRTCLSTASTTAPTVSLSCATLSQKSSTVSGSCCVFAYLSASRTRTRYAWVREGGREWDCESGNDQGKTWCRIFVLTAREGGGGGRCMRDKI